MAFKINYKGTSSQGTTYDYRCTKCSHDQRVQHPMQSVNITACEKCGFPCKKVILSAPSLDADHHDSMRFHNLGWEDNG